MCYVILIALFVSKETDGQTTAQTGGSHPGASEMGAGTVDTALISIS